MSGTVVAESIPVLKRSLGITNIEAKAILPVFAGGNMTAGGISVASGEPLNKVERALDRLEKKGLVTRIEGVVPIFRLSPTIFALEGSLSSVRDDLQSNLEEFQKMFDGHLAGIDKSVNAVSDLHKNTMNDGKVAFQAYETEMVAAVQSQVESITSIATEALAEFTRSIEEAMKTFDVSLDDGLGTRLSALQLELDKSQKELGTTAKGISKSFEKWLTSEGKSTTTALKALEKEMISLTHTLRDSVSQALRTSRAALDATVNELADDILTKSTASSDDAINSIGEATKTLDDTISDMDSELAAAFLAAEETLRGIATKGRSQIAEESEAARTRIEAALEICDAAKAALASWKEEVATFGKVGMQSLRLQLDRVSAAENDYLENVKAAVRGNLEKTQAHFANEYHTLKTMSIEGITQFGSHLDSCRALTLDLLKKQLKSQEKSLESTNLEIKSNVDKWSSSTTKNVETKLSRIITDVSKILETEVSEMDTLAESIDSRLKSAFSTVMSTSSTKNASALASVKKSTHDFEAEIGMHLSELSSGYVSTTRSHIQDAKALYENLNEKLDERLGQSVGALTSHANRVQREIDKALAGQVERIDQHASGMREELRIHLEDLAQQFTNLIKGLEATFNGFLSSQTSEARDLIASAHTEFKGSLKTEMASLQEDSKLLQEDFSSQLGGRIDELVGAVDSIKKALDELSANKRTEISESMADTLQQIEDAVRSTEDALKEIETGTIHQFGENLYQVSREFSATVTGARDNIAERISSISESTQDGIAKSIGQLLEVVDAYTKGQRESGDLLMADTSKKMDSLASQLVKASNSNVEAFQNSLAEKETSRLESARAIREEALASIEDRRNEVALIFTGASETIETSTSSLTSSLEQLANRLDGEISTIGSKLEKAADTTASKVLERGENSLKEIETKSRALFKKTESDIKSKAVQFGDDGLDVLTKAAEALSDLPNTLTNVIATSTSNTIEQTTKIGSETKATIDTALTDFSEASKSITNTSKTLIDGMVTQAAKGLEKALEEAKQGSVLSNQYASRKLESIGIELKTCVGSESARLTEHTQNEVTAKNAEIASASAKAMNDASEGLSVLRQTRNDAFNGLNEHVDKILRQWSTEQKKDVTSLKGGVDESIGAISELTIQTVEAIEAVKSAREDLFSLTSGNTWYLTGADEICAHMLDMVSRAERSVLLSVLDLECLDLRKLAKVKGPRRRILVVPETEEIDSALSSLEGWRIWHTKTPTTLALIDKSEVLVGGSEAAGTPLAVVSRDESYLRLYHDYLGPVITKARRS
ncbi:MAG: helix-turn-helix domain-containing protein [Candidatus Thorarchaeota archaeon]